MRTNTALATLASILLLATFACVKDSSNATYLDDADCTGIDVDNNK